MLQLQDMAGKQKLKRILTDAAGYGLLLAALLTGWLPGPGGIPMALAGLSLLSIHNTWARRLRVLLIRYAAIAGASFLLRNPLLQIVYDIAVLGLLAAATVLFWIHGAHWQVALGVSFCTTAIILGLINRNRFRRLYLLLRRK